MTFEQKSELLAKIGFLAVLTSLILISNNSAVQFYVGQVFGN